jgi:hypothetical protein
MVWSQPRFGPKSAVVMTPSPSRSMSRDPGGGLAEEFGEAHRPVGIDVVEGQRHAFARLHHRARPWPPLFSMSSARVSSKSTYSSASSRPSSFMSNIAKTSPRRAVASSSGHDAVPVAIPAFDEMGAGLALLRQGRCGGKQGRKGEEAEFHG